MSRIFKAPNVQIEKENFRIDYTPTVDFNQNLKEFEEIDDEMDFGVPNFEEGLLKDMEQGLTEDIDNDSTEDIDQSLKEMEQSLIQGMEQSLGEESTPKENYDTQKNKVLENANEEAEKILEEAKISAINLKGDIYEEARVEGYEAGYNTGLEEAKAEMAVKLETELNNIENIKSEIENEKEIAFNSLEGQAVEVIGNVLENIIGTAFEIDSSLITQLVAIGLKQSNISSQAIVKVSPDNFEMVNSNIDELYECVDSNVSIELITDKSLESDECIIENELGFIKCEIGSLINSLKLNLQTIYNNSK